MFSLPTSVLTKKKTPCKARTTKNISEIEHLLKYIKINVALKKILNRDFKCVLPWLGVNKDRIPQDTRDVFEVNRYCKCFSFSYNSALIHLHWGERTTNHPHVLL